MTDNGLLKKDLFGEIRRCTADGADCILRDAHAAAPALRWLARHLLRREARALALLDGTAGVPELLAVTRSRLTRRYLPGAPLQVARIRDPAYYRAAAGLLRRLHRIGIVHNDLAKEPNWLVLEDGSPALIDFQLAGYGPRRGRLFRILAYEDLRHLLKHKRSYCPGNLTRRELGFLAAPAWPSRVLRRTLKPAYRFVTRRLLRWADREGAGDRNARD